jgi:hypothetical protein
MGGKTAIQTGKVEAQVLVYIPSDFFAISLHARPDDIDLHKCCFFFCLFFFSFFFWLLLG